MRRRDDEGSVLTEGRGHGRRGQERGPGKLGRLDGQPGSASVGDALATRPAGPVVLGAVVLMMLRLVGAVGGGASGQASPGGGGRDHPDPEYTRE